MGYTFYIEVGVPGMGPEIIACIPLSCTLLWDAV